MLYTNLNHIVNAEEFAHVIGENENVMVICGSMRPLCIQAYRIAEELEVEFKPVKFYDIEYDDPNLTFIKAIPQVKELAEIPYILYFKNGEVVKATSGNQTKKEVSDNLENEFAIAVNS